MNRLSPFPSYVQATILYLATPDLSFADIGKRLGISRQAAHKQVKIGKISLEELSNNKKLIEANNQIKNLQDSLQKQTSLISHLRRRLILQSVIIFLLKCFKERVKKFFPKFEVKRFEPFEKKYILDMWTKFQRGEGKLRDFCKNIQKSEETIKSWIQSYEKHGMAGLKDKTTRPRNFSNKIPLWLKEQLLILFIRFPDWSPYQYYKYIKNNPATNYAISIGAIEKLRDITKKRSQQEKDSIKKRWAFEQNFSVWTIDFTCILKTENYKLQLLTVSDQRSRFWFEPILLLDTSTDQVIAHLEELFIKYGRPIMIKSDNGPEFRTDCRKQLNDLGTYLFNSPTYYGQFCGAHERIHRTLKGYISDFSSHKNITRLVSEIQSFTEEYNHVWPHEYLENKTPAEIYFSNEDFIPKGVEIIKPYEKDGQLRMKFTNRHGKPARMSLDLINTQPAS